MNNHTPAPSITCARMELILPILEGGDLDAVTMAAALEHLRTCAHCQREQEHYSALDQALRDRFGFAPVRPYATEEIMRRITERSQSTEQPAPVALNDSTSQRSTRPSRSARFYRPWLSGLGAVAVVAVLLGMAALLFGGRLGFGVGSGGPPRPSFAGTQGLFADVSMVSPTEGWALAQVTKTPDGKTTHNTVTFYHYQNGIWTPVTLTLSAAAANLLRQGGPGGFNGVISMDSATDGWAIASNFNRGSVLFHFTGSAWREAPNAPSQGLSGIQALSAHSVWAYSGTTYSGQTPSIFHYDGTTWTRQTIGGVTAQSRLVTLQMASDSLGWALMSASGDYANPNYTVAQYAGNNTWTVHSTINAGNLGEISGLAMVSPEEGWAFGASAIDGPSSVTAGKATPQALYHYSHGRWQTAPVSLNDGVSFVTLEKIVMRSASDGWIIAQDQNQRPGITASGIERHTILLHYDGASWTQAPTPDCWRRCERDHGHDVRGRHRLGLRLRRGASLRPGYPG